MTEYEYTALWPIPQLPSGAGAHLGHTLTLLFVIAAMVLSLLSLIALWWFNDLPSDENNMTIVEGDVDGDECAVHCLHLTALFLGTAMRLLLGGLGTMVMVWGSISQD